LNFNYLVTVVSTEVVSTEVESITTEVESVVEVSVLVDLPLHDVNVIVAIATIVKIKFFILI
jgi:hypothetical protein